MSNIKKTPPIVMVIGGMDPCGGAGLCADIQTLSKMGCHAAPVVTAITIQDTVAVRSFRAVETSLFEAQMRTVLEDLSPSVVKTGMLANREIISVVASLVGENPGIRLIVDPVMSSNSDDSLSECSLIESMKSLLFPLAALITPNILEARMLAGMDAEADECATALSDSNCMITGTHAESSNVINRYYQQGIKVRQWSWPRLEYEYHGSGCTLASAIAAGLAQGLEMEQALQQAQQFVIKSLQSAFRPGHGQHIPDRLCCDTLS
ncbi:MAG: hydroxymethylpyrimidine/phosphomethylpyrimidine kinase [Pseudomonadota bacterium]|nr:hydroxymethylpyrimidine/phosphomethylpyrimidine kinase [Pseudomonadota bacterium]